MARRSRLHGRGARCGRRGAARAGDRRRPRTSVRRHAHRLTAGDVYCADPGSLGALPARSRRIGRRGAAARGKKSAAQAVHPKRAARRGARVGRERRLKPWRVAVGYVAATALAAALVLMPLVPLWQTYVGEIGGFRNDLSRNTSTLTELLQREGPAAAASAVRRLERELPEGWFILLAGPGKEALAGSIPGWPLAIPDRRLQEYPIRPVGFGERIPLAVSQEIIPGGYRLVMARNVVLAITVEHQVTYGIAGSLSVLTLLGAAVAWLLVRRAAALRRSEERYALAMEAASDGHADWNVETDEFYISPRLLEILGHPPDATFTGRDDWLSCLHPQDRKRLEAAIAAHFAGRDAKFRMDLRIVVNGETRWVAFNFIAVRDAAGKVVRWTGSIADIDDAKRDVATVIDGIPGLVAILAPDGDVEAVSGQLVEYCGQPLEAMRQWGTNGTVHPDDVPRIVEPFTRAISSGEYYEFDARVRRFDGVYRWHQICGVPVRAAGGAIVRWYSVLADIDDRKRALEALRVGESRFRALVELNAGGFWEQDENFRYLPTTFLHHITGYSNEERVGKTRWELPGDLTPLSGSWDEHKADLEAHRPFRDFEYRRVQKDGRIGYYSASGVPIFDDQGVFKGYYGVLNDITERKRAEDALRLSEERYALALEAAEEGHFDSDLGTNQNFASARTNEIYGFPRQATVANRLELLAKMPIHPDDHHIVDELSKSGWGDPAADLQEIEFRLVPRPGEIRWIHSRAKIVRDAQGRPRRRVGVVADITDRKRAEEALRESEDRFARAVAGSADGVWDIDLVARTVYFSPRTRELCGLPPGPEVTPLDGWFEALPLHPEDMPRRFAAVQAHLSGKAPAYDGEFRFLQPDGVYRWRHLHGVCVRDAGGKPLRMAGSISDVDARRRAEEDLRLSEERYSLAVEGANQGVFDWDLRSDRVFHSRRAQELFGLQPGESWRARSEWVEMIRCHPEDVSIVRNSIRAHLNGQEPACDGEFRIFSLAGEVRWLRQRGVALRDASGLAYRMAGSIEDITDRKRAEEALQISEERYALALEASEEGHFDIDLQTGQIFVSARVNEVYGHPPQARTLSREDGLQLVPFHPDDRARMLVEVSKPDWNERNMHEVEFRIVPRPGETRWVRTRAKVVRDAQGRARRRVGVLADITDRKHAVEALREQTERLQLGQAAMQMIIMDWNVAEDRLTWSDSPEWLRGPVPESGSYPPFKDQVHPEDRDSFLATRARALETLEVQTTEFRLVRTDGKVIWVLEHKHAFAGADGKAVRMLAAMFDITERKRMGEELQRAQRLEAMGTLAGGIAHDFNNILGAILGYGEMALRDAKKGTRLRRDVDSIMAAGERGRALVDRVLAFSRSGVGERVPVHVDAVVREALDQVAAKLPRNVTVTPRLSAGRAAMLGDPTQVHQVIMNLASNAVQAMPRGGTLRVALETATFDTARPATVGSIVPGEYIVLRVSDTGTGIPDDVLEHMFDPFFTTKEAGVGSGLGLSLVHGIVTNAGGAIDVATKPGKGTTFTVYLRRTGIAPERRADESPPLPRGEGQRVLVVDDEEPLVRLATETLEHLGYTPVGFTSSTAALAAFRADPRRFDAVLTDERMPVMSGSALIREVRGIRGAIPVVLMSGYLRADGVGADVVVKKPLLARDLAASIARALHP